MIDLLAAVGADVLKSSMAGWLVGLPLAILLLLGRRLLRGIPPRLVQLGSVLAFGTVVMRCIAVLGRAPVSGSGVALPVETFVVVPAVSAPVLLIAVLVWGAGVGSLGVRELRGWRELHRMVRGWRPVRVDNRGIVMSGNQGLPMTVGWLRPRVFVPRRFLQEVAPPALDRILAHEHDHARWRDPLSTALLRMVRIVFWPVLPLLLFERIAREESEAAADRSALRQSPNDEDAIDYAEQLLRLAARAEIALTPSAALVSGGLEQRVRRIFERRRLSLLQVLLSILLAVGASTAVSAVPLVSMANPDDVQIEKGQRIELRQERIVIPSVQSVRIVIAGRDRTVHRRVIQRE